MNRNQRKFQCEIMNIAFAGNTSLAYYCVEKLSRAGYSISSIFLPRKGQVDQLDIVDISPIAGEFNIRQIWLPLAKDAKESFDIDLLIKLEWPERLKIPIRPTIAILGSNLCGQYFQGQVFDVAAAIYNGQLSSEIQMTHMLVGDIDAVPLKTKTIDFNIFDDVRSLKSKASIVIAKMLMEFLDNFQNEKPIKSLKSNQQILPKAKIERSIDWRQNVNNIHNLIRALTHPGPGAFSQIDSSKVYIWHGHPFDIEDKVYEPTTPGVVLDVIEELGVVVKTASGAFLITRIQPAGFPELPAWVWAYEFHVHSGDCFKVLAEEPASILV
jgi:methionyl-tRNA formyltransferase